MNSPRIVHVNGRLHLRCGCGAFQAVEPNTRVQADTELQRHATAHVKDRYRGAVKRFGNRRCPHDRPAWNCFECHPLILAENPT